MPLVRKSCGVCQNKFEPATTIGSRDFAFWVKKICIPPWTNVENPLKIILYSIPKNLENWIIFPENVQKSNVNIEIFLAPTVFIRKTWISSPMILYHNFSPLSWSKHLRDWNSFKNTSGSWINRVWKSSSVWCFSPWSPNQYFSWLQTLDFETTYHGGPDPQI